MEPAATVIVFVGLLGAVVGSFLNVVIYRLPRGLSVHEPRRSFCPSCGTPIKGYHNVPVLSWLWLRGRCCFCNSPIPIRYPLVELATALAFMTIWDQLFVAAAVPGTTSLATDWMLALGYLTLFACLFASAAMDIESYTIDIRVCILAMAAGVVAQTSHGLSKPILAGMPAAQNGQLPPSIVLIGAAMGATWMLTYLIAGVFLRSGRSTEESLLPSDEADGDPPVGPHHLPEGAMERVLAEPSVAIHRTPIVLFLGLLLCLAAWQIAAPHKPADSFIPAGGMRAMIASAVLMFLLILAAWAPREVDEVVIQEIEETRSHARGTAMRELAWLLPAACVGAAIFWYLRARGHMNASWPTVIDSCAVGPWLASRLAAGASAIAAMTLAAAIGWSVRILGTLAFGKEAYGTGDIYLMAAIGAAAGLWNCFFGFFLSSLLALAGVAVTMVRRSHRAIPFGPWLALGSFAMLALERSLLRLFENAGAMLWSLITGEFV